MTYPHMYMGNSINGMYFAVYRRFQVEVGDDGTP